MIFLERKNKSDPNMSGYATIFATEMGMKKCQGRLAGEGEICINDGPA